jgi:hypothetical protein
MNEKSRMTLEEFGAMPIAQIPVRKIAKDHQTGEWFNVEDTPSKPSKIEDEWHRYYYEEQLVLAKFSRNALIAVQAELHHLRYQSFDKNKPVALGNTLLKALGFHRNCKADALKGMEKAGLISVEWRKGKPPLVTFTRRFPSILTVS